MVYCAGKLIENGFRGLVNHSPSARDVQTFLVFSQHAACVIVHILAVGNLLIKRDPFLNSCVASDAYEVGYRST